MDFKMPKSQEQLQNKELESIAGGRLNDLLKNLSLRGKVARWAAVAASVVGISVSMAMPTEAINYVYCNEAGYFKTKQVAQNGGEYLRPYSCFANAGDIRVELTDVVLFSSGNNAGYIETDKGRWDFEKWTGYDFLDNGYGSVTILRIVIY